VHFRRLKGSGEASNRYIRLFHQLQTKNMRLKTTLLALLFICTGNHLYAQSGYWTAIPNSSIPGEIFSNHYKPAVFTSFILDETALRARVAGAPLEGTIHPSASAVTILVPNALGAMERYTVVESPVMEPSLADKYPMIRTYLGVGVDHPGAVMRFDLTPNGFNASILSPDRKTIYINTVDKASGTCVVFDRNGMSIVPGFSCKTEEVKKSKASAEPIVSSADDGKRRTYRLALTVNGEFSLACLDGTEPNDAAKKAKVLSVLTTDLNRANGIYDRDFGIRMTFPAGMDAIIYLDPFSDPILTTNSDNWNTYCTSIMNGFGNANFDVGHLIGKVSVVYENGNAGCIGCVCNNAAGNYKGSGFTAHSTVQGDPLVVDYWTHEMGHQFGAYHTFTFNDEGSGANMEPGSGSTIMGYAGITGSTDVQAHSDDYFHAKSIDQITNAIKGSTPSTCAVVTNTGNSTPVVNAGADYTIPKGTPFLLTGSATDANAGDVLSYCWEQYDVFASGSSTFPNTASTGGPVFRSFSYGTSSSRTFPALASILSGANGSTWEALPNVARPLNFRLTVRDNAAVGGANQYDNMVINVNGASGPFRVSAPNTGVTWKVGEFQTITWDVAGSNTGAVNCANVAIELSTDGGNTFPVVLAASTANDGSHEIVVPNNITASARVRIRGIGNIFFDISNSNFVVQAASASEFVFSNPDAITACTGSPLSTTLNTSQILGFSTAINLSASGNPAGSTVVFGSGTITPGNSTTVSLQGSVAAGTYNITVTGTAGSVIKTRIITFNVIAASNISLVSPADAATNVQPNPTFNWSAIAGATNYTLTIALNPGFTTIYTTVSGITGTSYTSTTSLLPNTQFYWKVTTTSVCGVLSSAARSLTSSAASCGNAGSADVPKTISPASPNTVTSTLNITGSGTITDVDVVGLTGTHSWISDLKITLRSPSFTTITLFDEICDDEDDFNINLDDAAPTFTFPCPPTGNVSVVPQQSLSAFNSQSCNGTWTLTVQDKYSQDGGSLTGWGLRICLSSGSLPVNWLDFTAKRNGEKAVLVQWSTASELNNKFYEVQRSTNGTEFGTIGTVNAGSASTGVQQYLFNDLRPFAGVNYYRLKQVDKDGRFTYSAIVKVAMPNDRTIYTLTPNPAVNSTTFTALSEMKQVNVRMMDVSGKTVYSTYSPLIKAGEALNLPVSGLAKGYYLVMIDSQNGRFTEKLIVH
jgi:subtilisin-like proprotein convertase family protein